MDIRKIKKLIELLEDSSLSEIEIVEGEESVRLSRGAPAAGAPVQHALPANVQAAAWSAPAPAAAPVAAPAPAPAAAPPVKVSSLGGNRTSWGVASTSLRQISIWR